MTIRLQNFSPNGNTVTVAATTSSQNAALPQRSSIANPQQQPLTDLRILNASASVAFVQWGGGAQTATANSTPVLPNSDVIFTCGAATDNVAVLLASGTGNVYFQLGEGN